MTLCTAPVAVGVVVLRSGPDAAGTARTATASPKPAPSPGAGDADPGRRGVAARPDVRGPDRSRRTALLAGDEKGFLAVADPAAPATAVLRRQYASCAA